MFEVNGDYTEVQGKIIEAARQLFVKKGLKGTTVRDIAAESGVNIAMVNYYFRSKEKLFDTIFEDVFSMLADKIFYLMDSDLPFFELVRKWVYAYYDMLLEYPCFPVFVLNELVANPRKLTKKFKDRKPYLLYLRLCERIKAEEEKGTIQITSVPSFILSVISLSIFPFAVKPAATQLLSMTDENYLKFVDKHREYVADFIIKAIVGANLCVRPKKIPKG